VYNKNSQQPTANIDFIVPQHEENIILDRLDNSYIQISEMSDSERSFLNALILRNKPKKLLEIGVSGGGSSIVILNAIKDFSESKLYSIDLLDTWYKTGVEKTGYFVDNYPELKASWELYTGGLALKFMDIIGKDIDFCLIDTAHYNPGEILDILMVLPYLKDDAIVVFHDVKYHTGFRTQAGITNNLLMSSITGTKYLQGNFTGQEDRVCFPNIAGIRTNKTTKENLFEIFNLLTMKWTYLPTDIQQGDIISHYEKYYNNYYIDYIKDVFEYQKNCFKNDNKYWLKNIIKRILGQKNIRKIKKLKQNKYT
jgi:predicted O-methyltransferase YrrM